MIFWVLYFPRVFAEGTGPNYKQRRLDGSKEETELRKGTIIDGLQCCITVIVKQQQEKQLSVAYQNVQLSISNTQAFLELGKQEHMDILFVVEG